MKMPDVTTWLTVMVAWAGWFVVNRLAARNDLANKKREVRVQYLVETYRRLAMASQRKPEPKYFRDLESAVADIQLFGSPSQIEDVKGFLAEWSQKGRGSTDRLLTNVRDDLRRELLLPAVEGNVHWFRPEGAPQ